MTGREQQGRKEYEVTRVAGALGLEMRAQQHATRRRQLPKRSITLVCKPWRLSVHLPPHALHGHAMARREARLSIFTMDPMGEAIRSMESHNGPQLHRTSPDLLQLVLSQSASGAFTRPSSAPANAKPTTATRLRPTSSQPRLRSATGTSPKPALVQPAQPQISQSTPQLLKPGWRAAPSLAARPSRPKPSFLTAVEEPTERSMPVATHGQHKGDTPSFLTVVEEATERSKPVTTHGKHKEVTPPVGGEPSPTLSGGSASWATTLRVSRFAAQNPPLREATQSWWRVPKAVAARADAFDKRDRSRSRIAQKLRAAVVEDVTSVKKACRLRRQTYEVFSNRYVAPPFFFPWTSELEATKAGGVQKSTTTARQQVKSTGFRPEAPGSIWAPRAPWADAKSLYDTEEVSSKRFERDWQGALEQCNLAKVILRSDADGMGQEDADDDGIPEEVEEVCAVLWEERELIFLIFSFYAALDAGDDFFGLGLNQWTKFIDDIGVCSKRHRFCKKRDMDLLFVTIDTTASRHWAQLRARYLSDAKGVVAVANARMAKMAEKDQKQELSRVEFTAALVQVAICRYVLSEELPDVSEAVFALLSRDIRPHFQGPKAIPEPNAFREQCCYTEAVTKELLRREASLRSIYWALCACSGRRKGAAAKLLGLAEWLDFSRELQWIQEDLSERDAKLAFIWSRMGVVDASTTSGYVREEALPFEGFLECLCRVAMMKSLPTDEEIAEAECSHAGTYLEWLHENDEDAYEALLIERATPWGDMPTVQSPSRCVAHTIDIMLHTIEAETAGLDNLEVSPQEVTAWLSVHWGADFRTPAKMPS